MAGTTHCQTPQISQSQPASLWPEMHLRDRITQPESRKRMKTENVVRTRRRAQITVKDLKAIVALVAKRLTEREACECIGVRPRTWYQWRERHENQSEYEGLLTRARAKYLAGNLEQIECAAAGKGGHRADWRAADRLNAILKPEVYGLGAQVPAPQAPMLLDNRTIGILLAAAYRSQPEPVPGRVIDAVEVKQIPETTEPPMPQPKAKMPPIVKTDLL
jgi:hypothetical protein